MHPVVTESADNLNDGSPERKSQAAGRSLTMIFSAIAILSIAGIGVSAVSLQRHYAKSATSFCELGEKFNCDIVNRSEYSEIMGIPVAGIGVVGYGILLGLSSYYRARTETPLLLLAVAAAGLVFALYLTYVEGYVLTTWCVLCLTSLGIICLISVLAGVVKLRAAKTL
jgi:vitamin-K-epoxide reductase (warfarin-sensitive)